MQPVVLQLVVELAYAKNDAYHEAVVAMTNNAVYYAFVGVQKEHNINDDDMCGVELCLKILTALFGTFKIEQKARIGIA